MKKLIILILIISFINCNKEEVAPSRVIVGRVLFKNRYAQDSTLLKAIPNQEVFLKKIGSSDDEYSYKVISDIGGNFYMDASANPSIIFAKATMEIRPGLNGAYYGERIINTADSIITIILEVDTLKQNGFKITLKDELGGVMPDAEVNLFNSQVLATLNNPVGAIEILKSDKKGEIFKIGLPVGNYYINATKKLDTVIYQRLLKQILVPAAGFVQDTIVMKKFNSSFQNGFTITVKDTLNGNIPGSRLYLYSSQVFASTNDSSGSIQIFNSDVNGKVSKMDIPAGVYYLNAIKKNDTSIYQRLMKELIIPTTGFFTDTIILKKVIKVIHNGLTITVKDSLEGVIPTADIYLYNSKVLASSNSPSGAIDISKTDNFGTYTKLNLPTGFYYINATKKVDSITYQRLVKSVFIHPSGIISDTIILTKK
jgi:hypothetical protein